MPLVERLRYGTPFKSPIVENELTRNHLLLRELKDTNYIVRTYPLLSDPEYIDEAVEFAMARIERWKRLASHGIDLPEFSPVLGLREDGNPSLFFVTERIKGPNLEQITKIDHSVADSFMMKLIAYSKDVFQSRGEYLYDQNLSQYVYGEGCAGENVYFVDLGSEVKTLLQGPTSEDSENSYFFAAYLLGVFGMIEGLEDKSGQTLAQSRHALEDFLSNLPENCQGRNYARGLRKEVMSSKLKV